jgi:hypothetical protein
LSRARGTKNKITTEVKAAVNNVFNIVNKDNAYLLDLAANDKPLFVALLNKCIPQAVAVDISHHAFDLGLAMREGELRLTTIDVTPDKVVTIMKPQPKVLVAPGTLPPVIVEPDNVPGSNVPGSSREKKAGGGAGVPPKP